MNTNSFEHDLKQINAPAPAPQARERARRAALEEFQRARESREKATVHQLPASRRFRPTAPWISGLAAAGVAAVGVAVYWMLPPADRVAQVGETGVQTAPVAIEAQQDVSVVSSESVSASVESGAAPAETVALPERETLPAQPPAVAPPSLKLDAPQPELVGNVSAADEGVALAPPPPVAPLPAQAGAAPPAPASAGPGAAGALQDMAATSRRRALTDKDSVASIASESREEARAFNRAFVQPENRDRFEHFDVNPVKRTADEPVSTFSADVDTASYSFVRRQLNDGVLPPADAVRVEEMVNYFDYAWPVPASRQTPFLPTIAVSDSPWGEGRKLVHIGIKGYQLPAGRRPDVNLVLLLDVSGSMNSPDKLPLAKRSMALLLDSLKPTDTIGIVVYAGAAGQVLAPTPVRDRQTILRALESLRPGGSTAGAEGIQLAYELAQSNFRREGVNRILLATDGDFNVGITDRETLKSLVEREREKGVYLSVLGFGQGNYRDELAQTLAQNGNGVAAYIDTLGEARRVLVEQAGASLFTIARDVKLQVEFNPATVAEYRLVGYESRALNREDFNNDKVDAGDIGAGHAVTAIYEITPVGSGAQLIDDRRYAAPERAPPPRGVAGEYGFLKIRYKLPDSTRSRLIEAPIRASAGVPARLQQDVRFSTAVAGFAQLLRGGRYTGTLTYEDVLRDAQASRGEDEYGHRAEFVQLVRRALQARGTR